MAKVEFNLFITHDELNVSLKALEAGIVSSHYEYSL